MKKSIKIARRLSIFAFMVLLVSFMTLGIAWADVQTDWGVSELTETTPSYVSLALRSDNYPGIAYSTGNGTNDDVSYRECTSGDCTLAANWTTPAVDIATNGATWDPVLTYDSSGNPAVSYLLTSNQIFFARYVGSGGNCDDSYGGSDAWQCTNTGKSTNTGSYYGIDMIYHDSYYHIVYRDSSGYVGYAYCDASTPSNCDNSANWNEINTGLGAGNTQFPYIEADSNDNLHIIFGRGSSVYYSVYYTTCNFVTSGDGLCDSNTEWTSPYSISSYDGTRRYAGDLAVSDNGTIGVIFATDSTFPWPSGGQVHYAEYVGSGGDCDDLYNGDAGADAWECEYITNDSGRDSVGYPAMSLDYTSLDEPRVATYNNTSDSANYLWCDSNCTTQTNWVEGSPTPPDVTSPDVIFTETGGYADPGFYSNIVVASNDYPRIAFSQNGNNVFYAEQDDEPEPPEEPQVPELPQNNLWKVLIAVLALGLVVGVAAFMKKKK